MEQVYMQHLADHSAHNVDTVILNLCTVSLFQSRIEV